MAITFGSEYTFSSYRTTFLETVYLDSTHLFCVYYNKSLYSIMCVAGSIANDDEITWGTPVTIDANGDFDKVSGVALTSTKIVVCYRDTDDSDYGKSVIVDVSGTTCTPGTVQTVNSNYSYYVSTCRVDSTHFVISYLDGASSWYIVSQVGTVSGTTITFGSKNISSEKAAFYLNTSFLDSTHFVLAFDDTDNSSIGTAMVCTISGDTVIFNATTTFSTASASEINVVSPDSSHACISFRDGNDSNKGTAIVASISGTTLTFGSAVQYTSYVTEFTDVATDSSSRIIVCYSDSNDSYKGKAMIGTISGTVLSFGAVYTFETGETERSSVSALSNFVAVTYADDDNSDYGKGIIGALPVAVVPISETIDSDAAIKTLDNMKTIESDAKIIIMYTDTIDSNATIINDRVASPVTSDAAIKTLDNVETIESDAVITTSSLNHIDSDAIIKQSGIQEDTNSDAIIKQTGVVSDITSGAFIFYDDLQSNILSNAKIVNQSLETIGSSAMIRYHKDFFSRAELKREAYSDFNTQMKVNQPTPSDPTSLTATDMYTGEAIELTWDDVSNYGYNVYKDVGSVWVLQNSTVITNTSYVVGGLTADVTYTFKVTGVNGEDTESTGVQTTGTPTYNAQELITKPVWLVYIDDVETDVVLDRIELVYGPDLSRASFHIMTNPSSGTIPDADYQSVVIYVNSRKVFTGTLIKKTSVYSPSELRVSYEALSSLWTYTRTCVGKNFNEFAKPWEYIYNTSLLYQSGCPWALPTKKVYGPVSVADSTKLEFMNSMCSYAGNYKVHCDENGSVSYHRVGNNMYTRTLEIGKHILNENLSVDKSDSVGQVSVYSDYQKNTTSKKVSYTAIEGLVMLDSSFFNLPEPITISAGAGQQQIQDVQVFALVGKPPRVLEYLNDIEVQPGHCYVGVTSTALSKWEDGPVTSDGEVSHLSGSEGRFPVKNYEDYQPEWQSFPALVEYSKDGTSATVTLQGTPVAYNTNIVPYTAKFYKQDDEGETVESTLPINIWNKPTAYATEIVIVYSYLTTRLSSSYGSTTAVRKYFESVQPYSISLPSHIDSLYLPGVPRSNTSEVNTYLTNKALGEFLRLSQSSTRGSISVIGDETIKLRTGVNGYEVVRVVHAFTSRGGFMTHLDITTEQFYYGEAVLNQKETKRVEEISSKSVGTYRSFYYDNEKVKQITGVLIQPGIEDPKSGTSHYSD